MGRGGCLDGKRENNESEGWLARSKGEKGDGCLEVR